MIDKKFLLSNVNYVRDGGWYKVVIFVSKMKWNELL